MGSVVISVEVDPGLGDEPHDDGSSNGTRDEIFDTWRRASYIFNRREIPATWLVAGELFATLSQSAETGVDDERHGSTNKDEHDRPSPSRPEHPPSDEQQLDGGPPADRQPASQWPGDETDASPCVHPDPEGSDWTQSARSMSDLIEGFQQSHVGHEIGCLPLSQADIEERTQDDAATAVRATFDAAAELGVETDWLRSFAFPDGRVGHCDVLAAYGFETYPEPRTRPRPGGLFSSLATLFGLFARQITRSGPSLVEPETDEHGLLAVPASMSLFPLDGRGRTVAQAGQKDLVARLAKRGVEKAAGGDGVFHLSIRLSDLRTDADFDRLATVVSHIADQRRKSRVSVETLGWLARRLGDHTATPPAPVR